MTDINVNFQLDKSIHTRAKELALKKGVTLKKLYTDWIVECLERETGQTSLYDEKWEIKDSNVEFKKIAKSRLRALACSQSKYILNLIFWFQDYIYLLLNFTR